MGFWEGYEERKLTCEQEMQVVIQEAIDAARKDAATRLETYRQLKVEYETAAFKVMDVNVNGTIMLKVFLEIFERNSGKQLDFLIALGFMTEKEKMQYRQVMRMQ